MQSVAIQIYGGTHYRGQVHIDSIVGLTVGSVDHAVAIVGKGQGHLVVLGVAVHHIAEDRPLGGRPKL